MVGTAGLLQVISVSLRQLMITELARLYVVVLTRLVFLAYVVATVDVSIKYWLESCNVFTNIFTLVFVVVWCHQSKPWCGYPIHEDGDQQSFASFG